MRYLPWIIVLVAGSVVAGCGKNQPVQAHDKPVSYWLEELKKPDAKSRKKAVLALGHVGTADPAAMPALMRAVKDPDATVRNEAVLALLNIGPDARDAIPVLTEAQTDKDATVRSHAAKALARIQGAK
jgi:HEAT repeat protein